jgi:hypothetical protein
LHVFARNIGARTANAMTQVLAGASPSTIADCTLSEYFTPPAGAGDACISPSTVGNIMQSPAFLAARQMTPQSRQLYADALSGQVAVATIQGALLDLLFKDNKKRQVMTTIFAGEITVSEHRHCMLMRERPV